MGGGRLSPLLVKIATIPPLSYSRWCAQEIQLLFSVERSLKENIKQNSNIRKQNCKKNDISGIFQYEDSLTASLNFGQNEIIADSESTPSRTSRKFISHWKNVSSFKVVYVQRFYN